MIYVKRTLQLTLALLTISLLPSCSLFECSKDDPVATQQPSPKQASSVKEIATESEFLELLGKGKPVIAKFYASWCGPCQRMKPIFAEASAAHGDKAFFASLENDNKELQALFKKYNVTGFPTFIYFNAQGEVVSQKAGSMDKAAFMGIAKDFIQKNS